MTNNTNTTKAARFANAQTLVKATLAIFDENDNVTKKEVEVFTPYARSASTAEKNLRQVLNLDENVIVRKISFKNEKHTKPVLVASRVAVLGTPYATKDDAIDGLTKCDDAANAEIVELPVYNYSADVFGYIGNAYEHDLFASHVTYDVPIKYGKKAMRTCIASMAMEDNDNLHIVAVANAKRAESKFDNGKAVTTFYVVDGVDVANCTKAVKDAETVEEITEA